MELFTASVRTYEIGHEFPPRDRPSRGHEDRVRGNRPWAEMEEILERHRREGEQPRGTAYFGCQSLEECAAYMESQVVDPLGGESIGPSRIHYYRVGMPSPTKTVMALIFRGMHHLGEVEVVAEICEEYWRQPRHQWQYFEFMGRTARVLEVVAPPNDFCVMGARMAYENDILQAKCIWPERK